MFFSWESIFRLSKMDKKNVQKRETQNTLLKTKTVVTIIEFYGLVTKKIILKVLS
jgi:hypothetical protein